jgi:heme exporter protein B
VALEQSLAPARVHATPSRLPRFVRQTLTVVRRDVLATWRQRDTPVSMVVFALLVLLIFSFAFDLSPDTPPETISGVLWSALIFGGMLGLGRAFAADREQGTLDGLLLAPIDRSAIYLARLINTVLLMLVMEVVTLPAAAFLFNVPVWRPQVVLAVLLGTLGFATVGTLFAAIAANSRARDVLLPVLLLPAAMPIILASVEETTAGLSTPSLLASPPWINLSVAYCVLFLIIGMITFEFVCDE